MRSLMCNLTLLMVVLATGCAAPGRKFDAGAVDHRMVDPGTGEFTYKYFPAAVRDTLDIVKPGDSVSIRLNAIYICDFSESNPFPHNLTGWIQDRFLAGQGVEGYPPEACSGLGFRDAKHYTRGEIVVLADVFEQGNGRTIAYAKNATDAKDARVIFYDDDIRESGQYFSIANIPVYGPIRYSGNPLFLRMMMLELDDDENAQSAAMLKKLADLGGRAYPPASPVLKALSSVGDALLTGDQDDLEFRYTMAFDPYPGVSTNYLPLAVGDYVMVKQSSRSTDFPWDEARYAPTTGAVTPASTGFRRVTMISFKVSKNEPALQQDGAQLFSEFEATLPAAGLDLTKLDNAADSLGAEYRATALMDEARAHIQELNAGAIANRRDTAAFVQADHALAELICDSAAVKPDAAADQVNPLRERDVDYILRSLDPACLDVSARSTVSSWGALCSAGNPTVCK